MQKRFLKFLALACVACRKDPSPLATPVVSAQVVAADASIRQEPVDLLRWTPSHVFVSSNVFNPYDVPEHLVDGRFDTAWNSATGDLVGAVIGFQVPKDAAITSIEFTPGYVKMTSHADLFLKNHRVSRIRVSRGDESLGEFDVDPNTRGFVRLPVRSAGGDFKIEVLGVIPGTERKWRELCMSEFRVMGTPGKLKNEGAKIPLVGIGSYGAHRAFPPSRKEALAANIPKEIRSICDKHISEVASGIRRRYENVAKENQDYFGDEPTEPYCKPKFVAEVSGTQIWGVRLEFESNYKTEFYRIDSAAAFRLFALQEETRAQLGDYVAPDDRLIDITKKENMLRIRTLHSQWQFPFQVFDDDGGVSMTGNQTTLILKTWTCDTACSVSETETRTVSQSIADKEGSDQLASWKATSALWPR